MFGYVLLTTKLAVEIVHSNRCLGFESVVNKSQKYTCLK